MPSEDRVTSRDYGYEVGGISAFPARLDDESRLYTAKDEAETVLTAPLRRTSTTAMVRDGWRLPEAHGVLRIADELIYYKSREGDRLFDLDRGFAGTSRSAHPTNSPVSCPCIGDMHNGPRDALLALEHKVGFPTDTPGNVIGTDTLWARAKYLKQKWFSPNSAFYAFNRSGHAPLGVQFADMSRGEVVRWVWDFGDGTLSAESQPFHVYRQPGLYPVMLTIYCGVPRNGVSTKRKENYIQVYQPSELGNVMFTVVVLDAVGQPTDSLIGRGPMRVRLIDQTVGEILTRVWSFGDGQVETVTDTHSNTIDHVYSRPGSYSPSLVVSNGQQTLRREFDRQIEVQA